MSNKKSLYFSIFFSAGAKLFQRTVGIISTLILARVLTPDDFALIAVISIALYLFDIFSQVGSEQYIIQKDEVSQHTLNSAWTLDIAMKLALVLLIQLFAGLIAVFFDKAELELGLRIASLTLLIGAFKNPGLLLLKRELKYSRIFVLTIVQRIVSFVLVITLAFYLKSFWAFILSDIAAVLTLTTGSYLIHKFRPRLATSEVAQQWQFSKWMLSKNFFGYLRSQIDTILVGKFFSTSLLGNYHMSRDIVMLPAHNLIAPAIEPLLASFREEKYQIHKLARKFTLALFIANLISAPIVVFLMTYSEETIRLLLGDQWTVAGTLLSALSLLLAYFTVLLIVEQAALAVGKVKVIFYADIFSLFAILSLLLPLLLLTNHTLFEVASLRAAIGIISTLALLAYVYIFIPYSVGWVLGSILLPYGLASLSAIFSLSLTSEVELSMILHWLLGGSALVIGYVSLLVAALLMGKNNWLFSYILNELNTLLAKLINR